MGLDALVREALGDRERIDLLWRVFLETRDSRRTGMSSVAPDLLERVKRRRENSLDDLEELLQQLKASVERQGGRFHLARNRSEACEAVHRILSARRARRVMKSKSMTTEEIGLNDYLASRGIEVLETDLGERVVQLAGERPSHLLGPALHLSRSEISKVLARWTGRETGPDPEKVVETFREALRREVIGYDAGITGANAIDAETGAVFV
jgi:Uncharacterized conserved protein containing a ferredoxin-like domain